MSQILEILKILIPPSIVAVVVYVMIKNYFNNEQAKQKQIANDDLKKELIPMKLQAMERMVLLLERITPHNMFNRMPGQNLMAGEYSVQILASIAMEFDHNVAQQLYVSNDSWKAVITAKDWMINLISEAEKGLGANASAQELKTLVLEVAMKAEIMPTTQAIHFIKSELA
ncbi:MAG: hypothetical protein KDC92_02200 [Bacteroidetes bacterium]|nr:hypothetical protein [Bacteroidota bacterium]